MPAQQSLIVIIIILIVLRKSVFLSDNLIR